MESDHNNSMSLGIIKKKKKSQRSDKECHQHLKMETRGGVLGDRIWHDL